MMTVATRPSVIVDGYSSGGLLAPEFRTRGIDCVHVQSTYERHSIYSFRDSDFIANIRHDGNFEATLTMLKSFQPRCVMVGTELGVELADRLSFELGTPCNDVSLTLARRNKLRMAQRIASRGLRSVRSRQAERVEDLLTWVDEIVGWPIVIKPVNSAGNDTVLVCRNQRELVEGFQRIHRVINRLGLRNTVVLAQELIRGTNYVVDTVTLGGRHHVTNIWKIGKGSHNGAEFVYEYNELLPFDGLVQRELVKYICGVLDALGIVVGPGHSEVMVDEAGPVLIETGARVHGAGLPIYNRECIGYSQVDLAVDAYIDPAAYERKTCKPYRLFKNLVILDLISPVNGRVRSWPLADQIRALRSFHDLKLAVSPGKEIHKTIDLFTEPGYVVLIHEDMAVIRRDCELIRRLEANGFYDVEPT